MKKSLCWMLCFIALIVPAKAVNWLSFVKEESWRVSGSIVDGTLKFDPLFQEETISVPSKDEGPYTLQVRNSANAVLYTRHFDVSTLVSDFVSGSKPDKQTHGPVYLSFLELIPFRSEAAFIVILGPSQDILGSIKLGGEPPKVTIISPATGFVAARKQTVSWTIANPHAGTYKCEVFYSDNGGTLWKSRNVGDCPKLSANGTMSSDIDFSTTKPASNAQLRIYVSDGVNTGRATSISFAVPKHAPQMFSSISSPPDGLIQPAASPVFLEGNINDSNAPDDLLANSQLQWTSDIQGPLGTGNRLQIYLKPGTHKIMLTGTDLDGYKAFATTSIVTTGEPPEINITTQPIANGCVTATIDAHPGKQGADLEGAVIYSYTNAYGWVDKMSLPLTSLPYTFKIPGTGNINIYASASDKSRQINVKQITATVPSSCLQ